MPKKRTTRIYARRRGGQTRYYADFRDYSDVGGKREALIPAGSASATSDPDVAKKLAADRLGQLEKKRRGRDLLGIERESTLKKYAARHLREKAKAGKVVPETLALAEGHLRSAILFFGADRDLRSIAARDVARWLEHLAAVPNGRGQACPECGVPASKTAAAGNADDPLLWNCPVCLEERDRFVRWRVPGLSDSTRRKYINDLSNLYRRAQSEGYVDTGYNPVSALMDKPTDPVATETDFLEVPDAALLLEAARLWKPDPSSDPFPHMYELLAAYLLTGGRKSEVLGLELDDISFDRRTVTFRTNRWRRLKTPAANRTVPMHPQLEEILRPYVFGGNAPPGRLLFPSHRGARGAKRGASGEQMLGNFGQSLADIAARAGLEASEVHPHMLRHTYASARIQTLDRGHPVSPWTVAKEMGHGGRALVDRIYGHLGEIRHRAEHVEYRVEQHADVLGARLVEVRAG